MKLIALVFHQRPAYAVDWNALVDSSYTSAAFVLVSTQECLRKMSAGDLRRFASIITVNQFEFRELAPLIDGELSKIYLPGDHTRLAVLSEFTMSVAAELRDEFRDKYNVQGPGVDIISLFRDKLAMKDMLIKHGTNLPRYREFSAYAFRGNSTDYLFKLERYLGYPMFAKPTDSAGSIGTAFIGDRNALATWAAFAANDTTGTTYELDEYIGGGSKLYHCDSVIWHGQPVLTVVNEYLHPNADARHGKALGSITLNPSLLRYQQLRDFTEQALKAAPTLPDGFIHTEVFMTPQNKPYFLEWAARAPGAKVPEAFEIRTGGVNMRLLHLSLNLGLNVTATIAHLQDPSKWGPFAAMLQIVRPEDSRMVCATNNPVFRTSGAKIEWAAAAGDRLDPNYSILDTIMSTVLWNTNYTALEEDFRSFDRQPIVSLKPSCATPDLSIPDIAAYSSKLGLFRGTSNVCASHLKKAGFDDDKANLAKSALFYFLYFQMRYDEHTKQNAYGAADTLSLALIDTVSLYIFSCLLAHLQTLLNQAYRQLETYQWHKTAAAFKHTAQVIQVGVFAHNVYKQGIEATAVSMIAGAVTQREAERAFEL